MSVTSQATSQPRRTVHTLRSMPNGTLFEIIASPEEVGDEVFFIRGTMLPGSLVPLHSHADWELFCVLEGSIEIFQSKEGASGWRTLDAGAAVAVPSNIKHAARNPSSRPATVVLATTSKLSRFFEEISQPFDPERRSSPPTPEEMETFVATATSYGYWMASPEENAAIGIGR